MKKYDDILKLKSPQKKCPGVKKHFESHFGPNQTKLKKIEQILFRPHQEYGKEEMRSLVYLISFYTVLHINNHKCYKIDTDIPILHPKQAK